MMGEKSIPSLRLSIDDGLDTDELHSFPAAGSSQLGSELDALQLS